MVEKCGCSFKSLVCQQIGNGLFQKILCDDWKAEAPKPAMPNISRSMVFSCKNNGGMLYESVRVFSDKKERSFSIVAFPNHRSEQIDRYDFRYAKQWEKWRCTRAVQDNKTYNITSSEDHKGLGCLGYLRQSLNILNLNLVCEQNTQGQLLELRSFIQGAIDAFGI